MVGFLRVIATDYDGTISAGDAPSPEALVALRRFRTAGGLVLLVTGRILSELRSVFPDFGEHFDAVIAENGAVLWRPGGTRELAHPIDPELVPALRARGVEVRGGDVLVACSARDSATVLDEIHAQGLDCQLVFNRSELMILPAGVTKGTGVYEALGDFGVSRHSAVGVGDAENDRALFDVCEAGVAVANALPSVQAFADQVMDRPNGAGFADLVDELVRPDGAALHSPRRRLHLGTLAAGGEASLPSSQVNVLVVGRPGSGKSHLSGLAAEHLIALGYCVLVIDPEGDHVGLAQLRGVVVYGGRRLPSPHQITERMSQRFTSVVLDLSAVPEADRQPYLHELARAVSAARGAHGLPHWIVDDEAHTNIEQVGLNSPLLGGGEVSGRWGFWLSSYRPDLLAPRTVAGMDAVIALSGQEAGADPDAAAIMAAASGRTQASVIAELAECPPRSAVLVQPTPLGPSGTFRVSSRLTRHQRHWHKYASGSLPAEKRFYMRDDQDHVVAVIKNLAQLRDALATCPADVLHHHAAGGDLSRWVTEVLADTELAEQFRLVEADLRSGPPLDDSSRNRLLEGLLADYEM